MTSVNEFTPTTVRNIDGSLIINPITGQIIASLNTDNPNNWTSTQTFGNFISFGGAQLNVVSLTSGDVLQYNGSYWINVPASSIGGVTSVSNSDGTLTISPTIGNVIASLNLNKANTWLATQIFPTSSITNTELAGPLVTGLTTKTAAGITLTASGSGVEAYAYTPSVSLGGDISGSSLGTVTLDKIKGVTITITSLTTNDVLQYNGTDWVNTVITSGVTSVSNSDGTLVISPNTGAVVASLALSHANSWTGLQTFGTDISFMGEQVSGSTITLGDFLYDNGTNWIRLSLTQGIGITISPLAGSVTITNSGVTSNVAGTGISVSGATGAVTITNSGVLSIATITGAITLSSGLSMVGQVLTVTFPVTSVFGRTGAVTAQSGDYSFSLISGTATNTQLAGPLVTGLTNETAAGITLTASGSGVANYAYTPSVSLGGDLSGTSLGAATLAKIQGVTLNIASLVTNQILQYNGTDWVNRAITSGVSSVSNSDGTLTISPTTGAVVASLALGHTNTWTGLQTFGTDISFMGEQVSGTSITLGDFLYDNGTNWVRIAPSAGTGITLSPLSGSFTITNSAPNLWQTTTVTSLASGLSVVSGALTVTFPTVVTSIATITGAITLSSGLSMVGQQLTVTFPSSSVTSVSNSDGTLTISPTTGAVVASIALGHGNSWTGAQIFSAITKTAGLASGATLLSSGSPYSVLTTDEVLIITTGSSGYTVDLPAANAYTGRKIIVIKADSGAGAITISRAGSNTIEGSTSKIISLQYNKVGLISDGSSIWYDLGTGGGI